MRKITGIQFRAGVEKAIHKIASDLGKSVSVTWSNEITTAAINQHGNILLANVADDAVVDSALIWRYAGKGLHELLHRKWTSFSTVQSIRDQYLKQLHNGVEDAWIENRAVREGLTGNVEQLLTVLVNGMVDEAMVNVKDWSDTRQYPFAFAVNLRLHGKTVPLAQGHERILIEAQKRLPLCMDTGDTLELAQWILSQLQAADGADGEDGEDQGEDQGKDGEDGQGEGDGKGEDGQGEGDGKGEDGQGGDGEGEGEGEGKGSESGSKGSNGDDQGEGKGEGASTPKKPTKAGAAKPVGRSDQAKATEPSEGVKPSGASGTYSGESGIVPANRHTRSGNHWDVSINASARLRYEVKRLFENTANDEWQVNRRAGSLNVRALPKVATSEQLFKRRLELEGVDSAVVVVLDVSGSMFEKRYAFDGKGNPVMDETGKNYKSMRYMDHAAKAAAALLDTLHRAGVKVALITFASRTAVFKGFDEPVARGLSKLAQVADGGNTNDYEAVRYAHELLARRPEARKAAFVITDGVGHAEATAAQVKSGEALGISTVGIGIGMDVKHIYPKAIAIHSAEDIGNASFKQIKLAA